MSKGTLIGGKYRLARPLGQGVMGEVWAAVSEPAGGEVALKLFRRADDRLRRRLLRDARAAAKLRHRNIVTVHEVEETDRGEPFVVMDLLEGESLSELLAHKRRLAPAHAARIARDVAGALAAAHGAGVVHRGLKPSNVFFTGAAGADPVTFVLDFGVHVVPELGGSPASVLATSLAYLSPEQIGDGPHVDHRTDLWSLGVMLFEMLTGRRPFDGHPGDLSQQIAHDPIPLVSHRVRHVDPGLVDLVTRCLERDLARRIGSADELAAALDRFTAPRAPEPVASPAVPAVTADLQSPPLLERTMPLQPSDLVHAEASAKRWTKTEACPTAILPALPVAPPAPPERPSRPLSPVKPRRLPESSWTRRRMAVFGAGSVMAAVLVIGGVKMRHRSSPERSAGEEPKVTSTDGVDTGSAPPELPAPAPEPPPIPSSTAAPEHTADPEPAASGEAKKQVQGTRASLVEQAKTPVTKRGKPPIPAGKKPETTQGKRPVSRDSKSRIMGM